MKLLSKEMYCLNFKGIETVYQGLWMILEVKLPHRLLFMPGCALAEPSDPR